MPFDFKKLSLPEVILITPKVFGDNRGFFTENYKRSDFEKAGIGESFCQDNISRSAKGVIRALHFQQDPHAQGKLVQCLRGKVIDVAVDIRRGSPRFGQWAAEVLDEESRKMLYVPPGFAHGYGVLSDMAEVNYKVTSEYAPQAERGILYSDPAIGVPWGIEVPVLSAKDLVLPPLAQADINYRFK